MLVSCLKQDENEMVEFSFQDFSCSVFGTFTGQADQVVTNIKDQISVFNLFAHGKMIANVCSPS